MLKQITLIFFFSTLFFNSKLIAQSFEQCDCVHPIIFVHGWVGSEISWEFFSEQLEPIWGDKIQIPSASSSLAAGTVYYANLNYQHDDTKIWGDNGISDFPNYIDDDVVLHEQFQDAPQLLENKCIYAISFQTRKLNGESFPPLLLIENDPVYELHEPANTISESNQSSIYKQGYALGKMIKKVLEITGKEKVILVGHSMGGLAIREYLQRKENEQHLWWVTPTDNINGHKVAKVLTVGTPHGGSISGLYDPQILAEFNGLNVRSESVRDFRTNYINGAKGIYLNGGDEDNIPDNKYLNKDVNCDGNLGQIIGVNNSQSIGPEDNPQMGLPKNKIKYTYYISNRLPFIEDRYPLPDYFAPRDSDGVVRGWSQWLHRNNQNNEEIPIPLNENEDSYFISDLITTPEKAKHTSSIPNWLIGARTSELHDADNLVRGLDEADYPYFASEVDINKWYAGIAQKRADKVPLNSELLGTGNNLIDGDWHKIEVTEENRAVKITLKKPFILNISESEKIK